MVGIDSEIRRELNKINQNITTLNRILVRMLAEQRYQNVMFRKAYNLSAQDFAKEDEQFRQDWK